MGDDAARLFARNTRQTGGASFDHRRAFDAHRALWGPAFRELREFGLVSEQLVLLAFQISRNRARAGLAFATHDDHPVAHRCVPR